MKPRRLLLPSPPGNNSNVIQVRRSSSMGPFGNLNPRGALIAEHNDGMKRPMGVYEANMMMNVMMNE